jgi:hypothetical protein
MPGWATPSTGATLASAATTGVARSAPSAAGTIAVTYSPRPGGARLPASHRASRTPNTTAVAEYQTTTVDPTPHTSTPPLQ